MNESADGVTLQWLPYPGLLRGTLHALERQSTNNVPFRQHNHYVSGTVKRTSVYCFAPEAPDLADLVAARPVMPRASGAPSSRGCFTVR